MAFMAMNHRSQQAYLESSCNQLISQGLLNGNEKSMVMNMLTSYHRRNMLDYYRVLQNFIDMPDNRHSNIGKLIMAQLNANAQATGFQNIQAYIKSITDFMKQNGPPESFNNEGGGVFAMVPDMLKESFFDSQLNSTQVSFQNFSGLLASTSSTSHASQRKSSAGGRPAGGNNPGGNNPGGNNPTDNFPGGNVPVDGNPGI